jgi:hypothetical protein
MDWAHLHLLINHAPLWAVFVGAALLAASLWRPSPGWSDAALWTLAAAGAATFLVYLTGDPAADALASPPGPALLATQAHRDASRFAFGALTALSAAALAAALLAPRGPDGVHRPFLAAVLALALASFALLGWVGHLGGQIQHPELRSPP